MTEPSRSEGKDERAFEKWRRSAAWVTGIGLTPEQEKEKEGGLLEAQRKRCERWKGDLMKSSEVSDFILLSSSIKLIDMFLI
jgi:inner membrane protease ATP23